MENDFAVLLIGLTSPEIQQGKIEIAKKNYNGGYNRRQHKKGLQRICPDDRLYTASERIEPDDQDRGQHCGFEGHAPFGEDELMHDHGNQEKTKRSDQESRHEKKESPRFMALLPKSMLEVLIDRGYIHFVIQRNENPGDQEVSQEVAHHDLQVAELRRSHPS